jgi:hypothetical protein
MDGAAGSSCTTVRGVGGAGGEGIAGVSSSTSAGIPASGSSQHSHKDSQPGQLEHSTPSGSRTPLQTRQLVVHSITEPAPPPRAAGGQI